MTTNKKLVATLSAALGIALGTYLLLDPGEPIAVSITPTDTPPHAAPNATPNTPVATVAQATSEANPRDTTGDPTPLAWDASAYAPSLAGTQIDGKLSVDNNGNLVLDIGVKDFFDYFLSAVGEVSPEQAIEEIRRQAGLRVPDQAKHQVMQLLADYITYQHQMQDFMQQPLVSADQQNYQYYATTLKDSLTEIKALRRQIFAPAAVEAFFGLDEAYADYAVASIELRANDKLSEAEKNARMADLEKTLPEQMRKADQEARDRARVIQQANEVYASGQGDSAVREVLRGQFDDAAIDQMLQQYRADAEWNKRLKRYMAERRSIQQSGLAQQDQQSQIRQLRESMFATDERVKVESYEAVQLELSDSKDAKQSS